MGKDKKKDAVCTDVSIEIIREKKLESVGILAAGIAQDFNALLSVIIGNLSLARMEAPPGERLHRLLEEAEKASLQAADLTQKLITFSSGGWLVRRQERLSTIVGEILQTDIFDQRFNVIADIPVELPSIFADEGQLKQVFLNLFLNAVEAMPQGGQVRVWGREVSLKSNEVDALVAGRYVIAKIEDQGRGIPREHMDKIFDPYFSTKHLLSQRGMGLGLSICYSILQKHKGYITIESEEGQGTTATLYLPAFSDEMDQDPLAV